MTLRIVIAGMAALFCGMFLVFGIPVAVALLLSSVASALTIFDPLHANRRFGTIWSATEYFVVLMAACALATVVYGIAISVLRQVIGSGGFYAAATGAAVLIYGVAHTVFAAAYYFLREGLFVPEVFLVSGVVLLAVVPLSSLLILWGVRRWGTVPTEMPNQT